MLELSGAGRRDRTTGESVDYQWSVTLEVARPPQNRARRSSVAFGRQSGPVGHSTALFGLVVFLSPSSLRIENSCILSFSLKTTNSTHLFPHYVTDIRGHRAYPAFFVYHSHPILPATTLLCPEREKERKSTL